MIGAVIKQVYCAYPLRPLSGISKSVWDSLKNLKGAARMKFGLEAEKFLFNLQTREPSDRVFSFLDGLSDIKGFGAKNASIPKITNEFVLNMVEFGTTPSVSALDVLRDYLFHYLLLEKVALREDVGLVPLASLPMDYMPHMTSKWGYIVQNSILSNRKHNRWMMEADSPLRSAGNCAGVHVHAELETPPEFLFDSRELVDKFNLGLMLTPMIAFSSSPYFFGSHRAMSMRGLSYYFGTYKDFPLNGGLPPVMKTSADVLHGFLESRNHWIDRGIGLGFQKEDLDRLTHKGANWNPIRWNRTWNTIELRCLDSDSLELDCAKFIWITGALQRSDLKGEKLACSPLRTSAKLDEKMISEVLEVSGGEVSILPSHAIHDLFERSVIFGTKDTLVEMYLFKLAAFIRPALKPGELRIFSLHLRALEKQRTTADWVLTRTQGAPEIDQYLAQEIVMELIERQGNVVETMKTEVPDIFTQLDLLMPKL